MGSRLGMDPLVGFASFKVGGMRPVSEARIGASCADSEREKRGSGYSNWKHRG